MADLQKPTRNVPLDHVMQEGLVARALTPLDKNGYTRDESYTIWIIDRWSLLIPGLTKGLSELDARYSPSSYAPLERNRVDSFQSNWNSSSSSRKQRDGPQLQRVNTNPSVPGDIQLALRCHLVILRHSLHRRERRYRANIFQRDPDEAAFQRNSILGRNYVLAKRNRLETPVGRRMQVG